jgi:hypothetical protein
MVTPPFLFLRRTRAKEFQVIKVTRSKLSLFGPSFFFEAINATTPLGMAKSSGRGQGTNPLQTPNPLPPRKTEEVI